ncbi:HAMP domain-containing histidine kinase [Clostridium niameyense]|uniref:histidine kinase n=1 Tax=Clostridium niameyense TaxID=1622073 RepID=A0A6M0RA57_9CLOT|nr:HAMP domain-containing sensor histidine kinase [Clostridium niameyense]NEZ47133.1 HAMP domain-containing histidine kinase [Clostridium niameyense]
MIFLILILIILIIILSIRLFYLESQLSNLIKQLSYINKNNTNKSITIGLLNKKIEVLSENINEIIDKKKQGEASKVKLENDLRQIIANMSHDLRTPLTSIVGYIQFLKLDNINEIERREYLSIAEKRAKSLEGLLNDFYELSLIESLDYKVNFEKINITRIVKESVLGKYSDFIGKDIKPNLKILTKNIFIIADKKLLERIIENLLSNCIKYAKDNIKIILREENNNILLKISNTTEELNKKDVEYIFDRFYMADKTRSGKGTGLGLSIAKGLIEKINGDIKADIKENVFTICCRFKILE